MIGGKYRLDGLLGEGGSASVWAVERITDDAPFAMKLIHPGRAVPPSVLRRFEREATAGASLEGPHVVRIEEAGVAEDGRPYLVMERLHGQDLSMVLRARGPMPAKAVLDVAGPVVDVLAQAHARGLIHRDLKPANVFLHVGPDGREVVKLLDFGSARPAEHAGLTLEGSVIGTPQFMAPEQARGWGSQLGPRTDVWGLGMLVVTLLAGRVWWPGQTVAEQLAALLAAPIEPPSQRWPWLTRSFDAWFLGSCVRDPDRRFPDVRTQLAALEAALSDAEAAPEGLPDGLGAPAHTWMEAPVPPARVDNLPALREAPTGRADERAALERLLLRPDIGVVTLLGPGGTGKTTLALAVADALRDRFTHGVCFVPLAPVRDATGAWRAIADALGDVASGTGDDRERVLAALSVRHLLLLLDNLEHLRDGSGLVAQLRDGCPDVALVLTSRIAAGVAGEHRFVVPPLDLPRGLPASPEEALRFAAVALLVRKAAQVRPGFVLRAEDVAPITAIAKRLDGLPLALELAASRLRVLSPAELLERLDKRFAVLDGASRDAPERHQTMRATLDWSYELLEEQARRVLRQLALFVEGFGLAAAEAVAEGDVLSGVQTLLDQSWLTASDTPDGTRFVMLETVRDYARDALDRSGERAAAEARFRAWHVDLAYRIEEGLGGGASGAWLERASREHANLRIALALALRSEDADAAVRMAGALSWFWYVRGHYREARSWLDRALQRADAVPAEVRSKAMAVAGRLALLQCDYERAQTLCAKAAALCAEAGDDYGAAAANEVLGSIARERGDGAAALQIFEASAERALRAGDERGFARASNYVAFAAWLTGDVEKAAERVPAALEIFEALRDAEGEVWSRLNLAGIALYGGGTDAEAAEEAAEALRIARATSYPEGIAWALNLRAVADLRRGAVAEAEGALDESLAVHRELGDQWRAASVLEAQARVSAARGAWERCARLLGMAAGQRARIGTPVPVAERPEVTAVEEAAQAAMGGDAFTRARTAGARPGARAV